MHPEGLVERAVARNLKYSLPVYSHVHPHLRRHIAMADQKKSDQDRMRPERREQDRSTPREGGREEQKEGNKNPQRQKS